MQKGQVLDLWSISLKMRNTSKAYLVTLGYQIISFLMVFNSFFHQNRPYVQTLFDTVRLLCFGQNSSLCVYFILHDYLFSGFRFEIIQ